MKVSAKMSEIKTHLKPILLQWNSKTPSATTGDVTEFVSEGLQLRTVSAPEKRTCFVTNLFSFSVWSGLDRMSTLSIMVLHFAKFQPVSTLKTPRISQNQFRSCLNVSSTVKQ